MANALSQSVGAQASLPGRQVIALAGDGGLTMLFGELITLTQNRLPVKVVVFDNSSLNFVEVEMKAAGFVNYGTDLENPDFAAVAQSLGIYGRRIEHPRELDEAVREFLAHDGPAVLDVATARQELSIPPTITLRRPRASRCTLSARCCPVVVTSSSTSPRPICSVDCSTPPHPTTDPGTGDTCPRASVRDFRQVRVQQHDVVVTPPGGVEVQIFSGTEDRR